MIQGTPFDKSFSNRALRWIAGTRAAMRLVFLVALIAGVGAPAAATEDHVDRARIFVAELADGALIQLSAADLGQAEKRAALEVMLSDALAVDGIARFALGRYWRLASPAQKAEFLALFRDFIIRGSADRMLQYSGQAFEITNALAGTSARADQQMAMVRSRFYNPEPVRITWMVASQDDVFKVVDVVIEGISLAQTYREEFGSVVRRRGMDSLLTALKDKQDILGAAVATR